MGILQRVSKAHIKFRPELEEHRAAYWELRTSGRQDARLRFELEQGYSNLLTMMQAKLADHFSKPVEASVARLQRTGK